MPLYEYQCDACGDRFEKIRKFSDPAIDVCPKCGGAVKKLVSSPAFQFKGTGWYITDYARKSSSDGATSKNSSDTSDKSDKSGKSSDAASSSSGDSSTTSTAPSTSSSKE